jgi:hypothetical protein
MFPLSKSAQRPSGCCSRRCSSDPPRHRARARGGGGGAARRAAAAGGRLATGVYNVSGGLLIDARALDLSARRRRAAAAGGHALRRRPLASAGKAQSGGAAAYCAFAGQLYRKVAVRMSLALHHQQQGGPLVLYFVGAIAASTTILCPLAAAAAAATTTTVSSSAAPSGLLADWLHSPAVGVSLSPRYSWVVPHITENGEAFSCPHTEQRQTAFQIQLSQQRTFGKPPQQRSEKGRVHWDSGRVVSAGSHQVAHPLDRSLRPATRYWWRVRTWTSAACMSQWSSAAELFTAPAAFSNQTKPIWVGTSQARYVLLRKVIPVPETPYVNAVAFVTAAQSGPMEKLLGSYRLFVGGNAVAVGPGRGNVRTAAYSDGGDKNHTQFDSIDLSGAVRAAGQVPLVIGLRCYHDTGSIAAKVLLELHLEHANGTHSVVGTNESWHGFNATAAFGPGLSEGPNTACYTAPQENIDARLLPHGWQHANFVVGAQWVLAEARQFEFIPRRKKTKPLELLERVPPPVWLQLEPRLYFADFRTNLMGGLRLVIGGARAGTKVRVTMSEELADPESHTLLYPMRTGNHYRAIWITRAAADGPSVIEHHEFKLFRYVEVLVLGRYVAMVAVRYGNLPTGHIL